MNKVEHCKIHCNESNVVSLSLSKHLTALYSPFLWDDKTPVWWGEVRTMQALRCGLRLLLAFSQRVRRRVTKLWQHQWSNVRSTRCRQLGTLSICGQSLTQGTETSEVKTRTRGDCWTPAAALSGPSQVTCCSHLTTRVGRSEIQSHSTFPQVPISVIRTLWRIQSCWFSNAISFWGAGRKGGFFSFVDAKSALTDETRALLVSALPS